MSGEAKQCFYCDGLVAEHCGHGDHFPLPKRHNGKITVPCCVSCHDMKDRFPLKDWPTTWVFKMIEDWPKMSRETRIFLAKAITIVCDAQAETKETPKIKES